MKKKKRKLMNGDNDDEDRNDGDDYDDDDDDDHKDHDGGVVSNHSPPRSAFRKNYVKPPIGDFKISGKKKFISLDKSFQSLKNTES
ncbi:hypothetical protein PoB_003492800 [Plakobranchus ocellatus]|uniref:Uncharacterized protein n=1 Tax=Plakobranchus ocellatus TaxID=259542 RepID=A0AAV4AMA4_9GAST|nr:hypothetical protein PoB_003492800 [Plakobranchus ocellatus]